MREKSGLKHQLLDIVQEKIDFQTHWVKLFIDLFTQLFKKPLPIFREEKGRTFSQMEYHA